METTFRDRMLRVVERDHGRGQQQEALIEAIASTLSGPTPWRAVPGAIHDVLGGRGWEWNGIYVRHTERQLVLAAAHGPLVCATLDLEGGVGSSGMCWDAVLTGQTLVATDVKRWPGYVSCDAESGLATTASIVCPIGNAAGETIAVWDLDSTQPLDPGDGPFMEQVFTTLSSVCRPEVGDILNT
ncbi:MAG: hypothetical protein CMJ90_02400 [Planctomycetes bacterium]|nr:hypothetical protein [Planctomycetota bacterium]